MKMDVKDKFIWYNFVLFLNFWQYTEVYNCNCTSKTESTEQWVVMFSTFFQVLKRLKM